MIPVVGIAKKISRLLSKDVPLPTTSRQFSEQEDIETQSANSGATSTSLVTSRSSASSPSTCALSGLNIDIPSQWRPETLTCIEKKVLNNQTRCDIIRTLVTITMSKVGPKPSRDHIEQVARKLVMKYPFMADDHGNGYTSWVTRMLERVRNVIKTDRKRSGSSIPTETTPKRSKGKNNLLRRYPAAEKDDTLVDEETLEIHLKAIEDEMKKAKPRDRVLLPLMKSTFPSRCFYIRNEATSVQQILDKYPSLKIPQMLEEDMNLITDCSDAKRVFLRE